MKRRLFGWLWRSAPKNFRRWGVWLAQPRFTVTAGAVVVDEVGRVLLLHHVFRKGSRWGIPGGFISKGEQPDEALRRELREEIGAELQQVEFAFARTLAQPRQVEIIFRCRMQSASVTEQSQSFEVDDAAWFERDALPEEMSADQRRLIERALKGGAHKSD
ncbi:MAG: NUDIX domain-containing protein [Pyrinomonadaceae bacterium]